MSAQPPFDLEFEGNIICRAISATITGINIIVSTGSINAITTFRLDDIG